MLLEAGSNREKKEFQQRIPLINSYAGVILGLQAYLSGFEDAHITLTPGTPLREWPGFLTIFNGKNILVTESKIASIPNGSVITKINGTPTKQWIDKNHLPYRSDGPKNISATYYSCAPYLFAWNENPFIQKPQTICIQSERGTKTHTLTWEKIAPKEFDKTFARLVKSPSWKELKVDPITITDITPDITWVKIPTFHPESALAEKMFLRSAQKLSSKRHKRAIVFDLHGNSGGIVDLGAEVLIKLFGEKEFATAAKASCPAVGYNPTSLARTKAEATNNFLLLDKFSSDAIAGNRSIIEDKITSPRDVQAQPLSKPVSAKIFVIMDNKTFSTSILFIDVLKELTNGTVTLIGQQTPGDSKYTYVKKFQIDRMTLELPYAVRRGGTRTNGEPHRPNIHLSDAHLQNDALLKKSVVNIINKKGVARRTRPRSNVPTRSRTRTPRPLPMKAIRDS